MIVTKVDKNTESLWDILEKSSICASPFIREDYLNAIGYSIEKYIVLDEFSPIMGCVIPIKDGKWGGCPICPIPGNYNTG